MWNINLLSNICLVVAVLHFFKRRSTLSKYVLQKMLELLDDGSWIIRQSQVSENIRYRNPGNPLGKKHPVRPHSSLWIPHHQDHHYHHWCRPPTCLLSSWCRLIRFICPSVWLKSASMLFRPAHSHKRSCLTMWTSSIIPPPFCERCFECVLNLLMSMS